MFFFVTSENFKIMRTNENALHNIEQYEPDEISRF